MWNSLRPKCLGRRMPSPDVKLPAHTTAQLSAIAMEESCGTKHNNDKQVCFLFKQKCINFRDNTAMNCALKCYNVHKAIHCACETGDSEYTAEVLNTVS